MAGIRRRDGQPQWVGDIDQNVQPLMRTDLGGRTGAKFDEAWLQQLLYRCPSVFPTEQIEPGFGDLIPVCRELIVPLGAGRSGALDNLYVTRDGGLALIEAKLWRNPEARRSVVAQAMEYAAAIFRMGYEDLQRAVLAARSPKDRPARSLAEIVGWQTPDLDEAEFVDAVSRNLTRGRAIIAVVGDGIREDILPLAELLQSHAGHRFTFALVELAVYESPVRDTRIVIPSVLAQTTLIERAVIRLEGDTGRVHVDAVRPSISTSDGASSRRTVSIGEDEFYDILAQRDLAWPSLLRSFLEKAEGLGLYVERKGGLNVKHASPSGQPLNLATISKDGLIDTGPSTWWDRTNAGRRYGESLAAAIGGSVRSMKDGKEAALRTATGNMPRISDLLPVHEKAWLQAARQYIEDIFATANTGV